MAEDLYSEIRGGDGAAPGSAANEMADAETEAHGNWFEEFAEALRAVPPPERGDKPPPELIPKSAELTPEDFDQFGPKAAEILRKHGVTMLSFSPGKDKDDFHHAKVEFKDGAQLDLDPAKDVASRLKIGKQFECNIKMGKNGELIFRDIKGLTAEMKIAGKMVEVPITKLQMAYNEDGNAAVTATAKVDGFLQDYKLLKSQGAMTDATTYYNKFLELIGLRCP